MRVPVRSPSVDSPRRGAATCWRRWRRRRRQRTADARLDGLAGRLDHPRLQRLRLVRRLHRPLLSARAATPRVNSHYLRLRATTRSITATTTTRRPARRCRRCPARRPPPVSQRREYVTILLGANDACTSTESTMTPVATFRASSDAGAGHAQGRAARTHGLRSSHPRHQAAVVRRQGQLVGALRLGAVRRSASRCWPTRRRRRRPTSTAATASGSGSSTSTRALAAGVRRVRRQLRLRRQRRLQLPVRAQPGQHLGLLPPQHLGPGGARLGDLVEGVGGHRLVAPTADGGRRPVTGTPASPS